MIRTYIQLTMLSLVVAVLGSTASAAVTEIRNDPDATDADFARSLVQYDTCVDRDPTMEDGCFKILWDPPGFIQSGNLTVDVIPLDGDVDRYGRVIRTTFFNGYTGNGQFSREDLDDRIRFTVPIVSAEDPADFGALDLVELQLADNGSGEALAKYEISGNSILVSDPADPDSPPVPAIAKPLTVVQGFNVDLTTNQEVPAPSIPVGFAPAGQAQFQVNVETGEVSIDGFFTDMTSEVVAAHLHGPADPGETATVIFPLEVMADGSEGTFSGSAALAADSLAYLLAGKTYINVHTELNAPGEIRGQIIPEPSSIVLLGLGLMAMALRHRRQKRQYAA